MFFCGSTTRDRTGGGGCSGERVKGPGSEHLLCARHCGNCGKGAQRERTQPLLQDVCDHWRKQTQTPVLESKRENSAMIGKNSQKKKGLLTFSNRRGAGD